MVQSIITIVEVCLEWKSWKTLIYRTFFLTFIVGSYSKKWDFCEEWIVFFGNVHKEEYLL